MFSLLQSMAYIGGHGQMGHGQCTVHGTLSAPLSTELWSVI